MIDGYTLKDTGVTDLHDAQADGIIPSNVTEDDIVSLVLEQEIVTWSTAEGSMHFDFDDLVEH